MRVIGGSARGRRLRAPRGAAVRPTLGRVREALFQILAGRVPGAAVLDLFAGTGALGIEALSRGAATATFVERDPAVLRVLRQNLRDLGLEGAARVLPLDARQAPERLAREGRRFDLVFLDPPYGTGLVAQVLRALDGRGLLGPGGLVVAEHRRREELPGEIGNLARVDFRTYGDVALSFYAGGGLRGEASGERRNEG